MLEPNNIRPVIKLTEAIQLAYDVAGALTAKGAFRARFPNTSAVAQAEMLELARVALDELNAIAPALGFGPKVISLAEHRRDRGQPGDAA